MQITGDAVNMMKEAQTKHYKFKNTYFQVTCALIPSKGFTGRLFVKNNTHKSKDYRLPRQKFNSQLLSVRLVDDRIEIIDEERSPYAEAVVNGSPAEIKKERLGKKLEKSLFERKRPYTLKRKDDALIYLGDDFIRQAEEAGDILVFHDINFQLNPARWGDFRSSFFF